MTINTFGLFTPMDLGDREKQLALRNAGINIGTFLNLKEVASVETVSSKGAQVAVHLNIGVAVQRNIPMNELFKVKLHQDDSDYMLAQIKKDAKAFLKASDRLQKDRNFVLKAAAINGWVLEHVGDFQEDFDVVYAAVNHRGFALEFAKKFQTNEVIVLQAIKTSPEAYFYTDKSFKGKREIVLDVLSRNGLMLEYVGEYQKDLEAVFVAISNDEDAFEFADETIKRMGIEKVKEKATKGNFEDRESEEENKYNAAVLANERQKVFLPVELLIAAHKLEEEARREFNEVFKNLEKMQREMHDMRIRNMKG